MERCLASSESTLSFHVMLRHAMACHLFFFYACERARGGTALSNRVLLGAVEGSMQASALNIVSASRVRHTCQTIKEKSCKVKRPRLQQHVVCCRRTHAYVFNTQPVWCTATHRYRSKGWLVRGTRGDRDCAQSAHLAAALSLTTRCSSAWNWLTDACSTTRGGK